MLELSSLKLASKLLVKLDARDLFMLAEVFCCCFMETNAEVAEDDDDDDVDGLFGKFDCLCVGFDGVEEVLGANDEEELSD